MSSVTETFDAARAQAWLARFAAAVVVHEDELTDLDRAIGDGDHGTNMRRGLDAAVARTRGDGPGAVLVSAGTCLLSTVGGASGPLYGTVLRTAGKTLVRTDTVATAELAAALRAGLDALRKLGSASPGDKTMVDALEPAVEALELAGVDGEPLGSATVRAAEAAQRGAEATDGMRARRGRASYLGERSVGHRDPGARSAALMMRALAEACA